MRIAKSLAAVVALTALLPGCATVEHHPKTDSAAVATLSQPQTFRFLPDKAIEEADAAGSNASFWHGEVEKAISSELVRKGYKELPSSEARLLVAFHVILQHGTATTFLDNYAGYRLSAKEQAEQADIARYLNAPGSKDRSILIVDIIDPVRREVIWREWEQSPIPSLQEARKVSARQRAAAIRRVVHSIFTKFPPKE